ncbi:pentraxin-4 isoform X1 [Microtus ochrogaster]|uniref:Pentraxin-4 n=1 Tax=Microtus ochrogaster TaxID=79684 RepID=A0A8J6H159_MICOH|nr:pentraxin-4 isoform X1 [Microtus ochrogaster]KAH0520771.1 Pentraxin-4 [Microtus ochrogaster]
MGCLKKTLSFHLIFVSIYARGTLLQEADPVRQRKPFFERLRRLEEQFQRFQQVTLTHLQDIANNYNVYYNVDARFQTLVEESQAIALAVNQSQAAIQEDVDHLKTWFRKSQRRSKKVDAQLQALNLSLSTNSRQWVEEEREQKAQREATANLALGLRALQDALASLTQQVHSQESRLAALEGQMQRASPGAAALELTTDLTPTQLAQRGPGSLQLRRKNQTSRASLHRWSSPQDFTVRVQKTQKFQAPSSHQAAPPKTHQGPGNICSMGPVLIFPNASTENVIFLSPGFLVPLRALSFCSWVRMASGHLGTLLSYATKDNDNKLVLHGRDTLVPGSIHFVIGDPVFRELSLRPLLDGQWHHVCIIWTSMEGRYWLHIDRRIVATGAHFREGYEIPPGGSLVLGQEQDTMGGQFDSSEAFVGSISGLAIWDRALAPREVANLATGKELPTGIILTLTNATSVGGFVQRANCTCLEQCP